VTRFNKILIGVLALQLVLAVVLRRGDAEPGIPPLVNVVGKLEAAEVTKVALFDKRKAGDAAPTSPKIELTRAGHRLGHELGLRLPGRRQEGR
jgi:hypothetical protein